MRRKGKMNKFLVSHALYNRYDNLSLGDTIVTSRKISLSKSDIDEVRKEIGKEYGTRYLGVAILGVSKIQ